MTVMGWQRFIYIAPKTAFNARILVVSRNDNRCLCLPNQTKTKTTRRAAHRWSGRRPGGVVAIYSVHVCTGRRFDELMEKKHKKPKAINIRKAVLSLTWRKCRLEPDAVAATRNGHVRITAVLIYGIFKPWISLSVPPWGGVGKNRGQWKLSRRE